MANQISKAISYVQTYGQLIESIAFYKLRYSGKSIKVRNKANN